MIAQTSGQPGMKRPYGSLAEAAGGDPQGDAGTGREWPMKQPADGRLSLSVSVNALNRPRTARSRNHHIPDARVGKGAGVDAAHNKIMDGALIGQGRGFVSVDTPRLRIAQIGVARHGPLRLLLQDGGRFVARGPPPSPDRARPTLSVPVPVACKRKTAPGAYPSGRPMPGQGMRGPSRTAASVRQRAAMRPWSAGVRGSATGRGAPGESAVRHARPAADGRVAGAARADGGERPGAGAEGARGAGPGQGEVSGGEAGGREQVAATVACQGGDHVRERWPLASASPSHPNGGPGPSGRGAVGPTCAVRAGRCNRLGRWWPDG